MALLASRPLTADEEPFWVFRMFERIVSSQCTADPSLRSVLPRRF